MRIYLLPEPVGNVAPAVRWMDFRYEDGPRDCEAVAFLDQHFYLLSKRDSPPRLYRVPLDLTPRESAPIPEAKFLTELTTLPQPSLAERKLKYGEYSSHPTAMDGHPDGTGVMVDRRGLLHLYDQNGGPRQITIVMTQGKTAAVTRDGRYCGPHPFYFSGITVSTQEMWNEINAFTEALTP